jgi:outer membrane protein assembly factor BamB
MSEIKIIAKEHTWPSMRGNQHNSGCSMHSLEFKNDVGIKYYKTNGAIFSTPIIDRDENIFVGSADGNFYKINPRQDIIECILKTRGVIDSAGCIDKDDLYVPSGDASLYKISSFGKKEWEFNILEKRYPRISTIYWWEGNVVVGPNGLIYAGNDDFYLYAINKDGNVVWSFSTGLQIWSAPAFNNSLVYFASFDMHVYALNQGTGIIKWKRNLKNFISSSPAVDLDGNVYVTTFGGKVFALNGSNGKIKWEINTDKCIYASLATSPDGNVFVGGGDGFIYCIDSINGSILWKLDVGDAVWSSMVIGRDPENTEKYLAYVGTSGGHIFAITPSGKIRWDYKVSGKLNYRTPGINASLALGKSGLVSATTRGEVLYIPYDFYKKNILEKSFSSIKISDDKPTDKFTIKEGGEFVIEKMEFISPEIINPLDQIGIASLAINVKVLKKDNISGKFSAAGTQTIEAGDPTGANSYIRKHTFIFEGIEQGSSFTMKATNCDFDITAFPVPLDWLYFECRLENNFYEWGTFKAHLNCRNLLFKVIKKYGKNILRYVIKNIRWQPLKNKYYIKTYIAIFGILTNKIWKSWGLINKEGNFDAKGFFSIRYKYHEK